MKPLTLTARISLLFAGAVAAVLLVTGVLIARAVEHHFAVEDEGEMRGKLELVRHILARAHQRSDQDALTAELDDALVGHKGLSVAVIDAGGRTWFASSGSAFPKYLVKTLGIEPGSLQQWTTDTSTYRGIITPILIDGRQYEVAISVDIEHHLAFMAKFRRILAIAMLLAAISTAALGWIVTRGGLQPLRRIARLAASVSADQLSERLPEAGMPAEIQGLSVAFNAMLDRLQDAIRRLTDFSSDIAHELRTPISNLMTQTQVTLAKARTAGEYREALESGIEEYERLASMISDMLFLAQADNHMVVPNRETVDLEAEIRRLMEFYEPVAEEQDVRMTLTGIGQVKGDRLMLQRAIANLASNALRHTASGGLVEFRIQEEGSDCRISVINPGPDIEPEHMERIFDRFYQVDPARREGSSENTGLGLAITKSLVEAHGGTISVTSRRGLTRFEIVLPTLREHAAA